MDTVMREGREGGVGGEVGGDVTRSRRCHCGRERRLLCTCTAGGKVVCCKM